MKKILIFIALLTTGTSLLHASEVNFTFADIETGQAILTADDNYFNRMSKAEIAIRMMSVTADKTPADLKAQYKANVLQWTGAEMKQISELVAKNRKRLSKINPLLPSEVIFIKVNDKVEGGLPHTRANAIILPVSGKPLTEKLFYHELFHVLSRHQKARHHELYGLVGFKNCQFSANDQVNAMKLTNPDVPAESYYLPATIEGEPSGIVAFLYASRPAYDPEIKGGFGGHFGFGLLKVNIQDDKCTVDMGEKGKAQILSPPMVPEFFAAIGHNTSYIIHAEEILAENFTFVMLNKNDLPDPEITEKLNKWLTRH